MGNPHETTISVFLKKISIGSRAGIDWVAKVMLINIVIEIYNAIEMSRCYDNDRIRVYCGESGAATRCWQDVQWLHVNVVWNEI